MNKKIIEKISQVSKGAENESSKSELYREKKSEKRKMDHFRKLLNFKLFFESFYGYVPFITILDEMEIKKLNEDLGRSQNLFRSF